MIVLWALWILSRNCSPTITITAPRMSDTMTCATPASPDRRATFEGIALGTADDGQGDPVVGQDRVPEADAGGGCDQCGGVRHHPSEASPRR